MPKKSKNSLVGKDILAPVVLDDQPEFEFVEDRTEKLSFGGKLLFVFFFCSAVIIAISMIGIHVMMGVNNFFDSSYLARHPILEFRSAKEYKSRVYGVKLSSPITVEKKQILTAYVPVTTEGTVVTATVPAKNLTKEEKATIVKNSRYPYIISNIWELETNKGENANATAHHNDCTKVGMSNEFGYRALDNYCFSSFAESVAVVDQWIDDHLKSMNINEMLCYYNTGKQESACAYAIAFSKIQDSKPVASK